MKKIDDSTYKAIKYEKKAGKRSLAKDSGCYGHVKGRRNSRLIIAIILLLMIISDVLFSVMIFHTRKTWLIIIACILSIPFARNLIDFFMCLRCKPLSKEEYEEVEQIARDTGKKLTYDVSITDEDGLIFIPTLMLMNNNIIAYTPGVKDTKEKEKNKALYRYGKCSGRGKGLQDSRNR